MTRAFLAALCLTLPLRAAPSAEAPADWRREGVDERLKGGLTYLGWRLEDDGRAISPETKAPASPAELVEAIGDLRRRARLAALERLNLALASEASADLRGGPLAAALAPDLPADLAAAVLDPRAPLDALRAMSSAETAKSAAYFDGSRTLEERRAAAEPVDAGAYASRVELPYLDAAERAAGDSLRAAAEDALRRDPVGRTVLARLEGRDGAVDLPPILIADLPGPIAVYNPKRGSILLDRNVVLGAVVGAIPAKDRADLRRRLSAPGALGAHLAAHPEAAAAVVRERDLALVHELTHAWQDRREPVLRELARGNLPDSQILEYEKEAFLVNNLYLHSKLTHAPESVRDDEFLEEYALLMRSQRAWWLQKREESRLSWPAHALDLKEVAWIQARRLEAARTRPAAGRDEALGRDFDVLAMTRGGRSLKALGAAQRARLDRLQERIARAAPERHGLLAIYYLRSAASANPTDRAVKLQKADIHARASGEKQLIKQVHAAMTKS